MARVLGIDPGTQCGWALLDNGARVASGTWDLSVKRGESKGMRFLRLECALLDTLKTSRPDLLAYEQTNNLKGHANEVFWGIIAIIKLVCERYGLNYTSVRNTDVKLRACGKGNAAKGLVFIAACKHFLGHAPESEDEADALWIALCGTEMLGAVAS